MLGNGVCRLNSTEAQNTHLITYLNKPILNLSYLNNLSLLRLKPLTCVTKGRVCFSLFFCPDSMSGLSLSIEEKWGYPPSSLLQERMRVLGGTAVFFGSCNVLI